MTGFVVSNGMVLIAFCTLMLSIRFETTSGENRHLRRRARKNERTEQQEEFEFWSMRALADLDSMIVSSESPTEEPTLTPTTSFPSLGDTSRSPRSEEPTQSPTTSFPTLDETSLHPSLGDTSRSPGTEEPTQSPTTSFPTLGETSLHPSLGVTSRSPGMEDPTQSPTTSFPTLGETSFHPSLGDTSRSPRSEEPTQSPTTSFPTLGETSLHPSLGDTSRSPGTEEPTSVFDPETEAPTTSLRIIRVKNSGIMFNDILNIVSYTTYCRAGEFTNIQIITLFDRRVYCITNFEDTGVEFGYEEDFPSRPIIKLNIEPPSEGNCEAIDDVDGEEIENHCGFVGKASTTFMSSSEENFVNDDVVDIPIEEVASFTTYCNADSVDVEIVEYDGNVGCYISLPGATSINLLDSITDEVIEVIDLDPSSCEFDKLDGEIRNVTMSVPCNFNGVATTVYPEFDLYDNGNTTSRML